jgi:hypothetical protein
MGKEPSEKETQEMFDKFNFDGDNSSFDRKEFSEFWNKMRNEMMNDQDRHGGPGGQPPIDMGMLMMDAD